MDANKRRAGMTSGVAKLQLKSTIGRPRVLTQEQVDAILAWHSAWTALKTLRQLAKELGVHPSTAYNAIRREFKKPPRPSDQDDSTKGPARGVVARRSRNSETEKLDGYPRTPEQRQSLVPRADFRRRSRRSGHRRCDGKAKRGDLHSPLRRTLGG
jgi:IS30 family transposase